MLPALGKFLTPEAPDPEKWKTVRAALQTMTKTIRLSVIRIVSFDGPAFSASLGCECDSQTTDARHQTLRPRLPATMAG